MININPKISKTAQSTPKIYLIGGNCCFLPKIVTARGGDKST